jgi:hypothetical protein
VNLSDKISVKRADKARREAISAAYDAERDSVISEWESGAIDWLELKARTDALALRYRRATAA